MIKKMRNAIYEGAESKKSLYDLTIPSEWNGKLVVFIHGYMGYKDWGCWNLVEEYFSKQGFGFLKYNVSHNGGTLENPVDFSDLESFSQNNYVSELQDFEAIIGEIQHQFEIVPDIYLIGHSRGGGVALLLSDNGFVKKICTWAAIADIDSRFPKGDELEAWQKEGVYYRENSRTKQQMPHSYSQYKSYLKYKQRLNIENYCRNSTVPTLVIHGSEDTSVNITEGKQIAEWLKTELAVIEGEQHTFGSSQPWTESRMPAGLLKVCEVTLQFFLEEKNAKNSPEKAEKLSLLSDLVKLAQSDNTIREIEFQFLLSIAGQMGVTKDEFKSLFEQYIEFSPPKLEVDRIVQFQRLILLMNVDLDVDQEEVNYIKDLGIRMGLHPAATDEILSRMNDYENKIVPPEKLLEIFKTFHN